jgi:hypothetical protein
MTDLPSYDLELKAADDRRRLEKTVSELRSAVRDKLDAKKNAREHLGLLCSISALIGLAAGYTVTGIFVHQ